MASEDIPKEFPDVSHKLSAPKKLSAFEKERQAAEEKRRRAEAENAAALKEFEDTFGQDNANDGDTYRSRGAPPVPRGGFMGTPGRFPPSSGLPRSGPGSLGPVPGLPGPPAPSLKRKRALAEWQEAEQAKKEREEAQDLLGRQQSHAQRLADASPPPEDVAPKPMIQLASLPPTFTGRDIHNLLRGRLQVHDVRFPPPTGPGPSGKRTLTAVASLSPDTTTSQIDSVITSLRDTYLGLGFRLNVSRLLASTALLPNVLGGATGATEPFGARRIKDQGARGSMRQAPPPLEFAPPDALQDRAGSHMPIPTVPADFSVEIQSPIDMVTLRTVHVIADRLLSEPDPERALEIESELMNRREVESDERFSFLYDSQSPAGVYYRYLLWGPETEEDAVQAQKRLARGPERIHEDVFIDWHTSTSKPMYVDLARLSEAVYHPDYDSSDEESEDEEEERRFNHGGREEDINSSTGQTRHLTSLQVARFAWLLSRLPQSHAKLHRGDVAAVTNFAISHAGQGAEEIVDMLVLNVEKPFLLTECAKYDTEDIIQDELDTYEPDEDLPTVESEPAGTAAYTGHEKRSSDDISNAKLVGLYVISDVLSASSTAGARNAWKYRQLFETALQSSKTFQKLGRLEQELGWGRIKADQWKRRVGIVFDIWESWSVFSLGVQDTFKTDFFGAPEQSGGPDKPKEKLPPKFTRIGDTGTSTSSPALTPVHSSKGHATSKMEVDVDGEEMDLDDLDGEAIEVDGEAIDVDGEAIDLDDEGQGGIPDKQVISNPQDVIKPGEGGPKPKMGFSFNAKATNDPPPPPPAPRKAVREDMFGDSDDE